MEEDLQVKRILQRISLASLLKEEDASGADEENEEMLDELFDDLMGWQDQEDDDDILIQDDVASDVTENADASASELSENAEATVSLDDSQETIEIEEPPSFDGSDDTMGTPHDDVSSISSSSPEDDGAQHSGNNILSVESENLSSSTLTPSSSSSSPSSSSSSSSSSTPSPSDVEAKIRDIIEKRENNNNNNNNRIVEGPPVGDPEEAPSPTPRTTSPSMETTTTATASSLESETWRDMAAKILTRLKLDAGLKMADTLKALIESPKKPSAKLKSNVDSWGSMTCPRKGWPAQIGVYAFH